MYSLNKSGLFLVIFLLMVLNVRGQDIVLSHKVYNVRDGLLNKETYCCLKDREGQVWFGTETGISCFNGYEFINYTMKDGLVGNSVFNLFEDELGRIWYTVFKGGIGYIQNGEVQAYPYNDKLLELMENGWVDELSYDEVSGLNVNILRIGRVSIDTLGKVTRDINREKMLLIDHIHDQIYSGKIELDNNWELRDELFELCVQERNRQSSILIGAQHEMKFYALDSSSFLLKPSGKKWGIISKDSVFFKKGENSIITIWKSPENEIWFCTKNQGIMVYKDIVSLAKSEKPKRVFFDGLSVSEIEKNDDGSMWICSLNQGVLFVNNTAVETYRYNTTNPGVSTLCKNKNGDVYYSCESGEISMIDSKNNHKVVMDNYLDVNRLMVIDSNLFISSFSNDDSRFRQNEYVVHSLFSRGFVVINDTVTWRIDENAIGKWVNRKPSVTIQSNDFFVVLYKDLFGEIWAGGNRGIFKIIDDELVSMNHLIHQKKPESISSISQFKNGIMVVASRNNGLYFIPPKNVKSEVKKLRPGNFTIYNCYLDEEDTSVWLATNKGVVCITFDQYLNYTVNRLSFSDGLPANEVKDVLVNNNLVYAATDYGLSTFERSEIFKKQQAPGLQFRDILINDESVPLDKIRELKHDENSVQFSFVGIDYRNAGNVNYRYRLEGNDTKWTYTKATYARYSRLNPGNYTFLVSASNEDGVWSPNQTISVHIALPYWKRSWFIAIITIALFFLILFISNRRARIRKARLADFKQLEEHKRKIVEAKLVALRAQMNPHFMFNALNGIQNIIINFNTTEAMEYIGQFSSLLRKILENSDKTCITLKEEMEMLKLYMNLENIRFNNSIEYTCTVDEEIEPESTMIPSMIIQPLIENAVVHGLSPKKNGEKRISVHFMQHELGLRCIIRDTGIGRVKSKENKKNSPFLSESYGTKIVSERLNLFNGHKSNQIRLKIIDCYDNEHKATGTRVEVELMG